MRVIIIATAIAAALLSPASAMADCWQCMHGCTKAQKAEFCGPSPTMAQMGNPGRYPGLEKSPTTAQGMTNALIETAQKLQDAARVSGKPEPSRELLENAAFLISRAAEMIDKQASDGKR